MTSFSQNVDRGHGCRDKRRAESGVPAFEKQFIGEDDHRKGNRHLFGIQCTKIESEKYRKLSDTQRGLTPSHPNIVEKGGEIKTPAQNVVDERAAIGQVRQAGVIRNGDSGQRSKPPGSSQG